MTEGGAGVLVVEDDWKVTSALTDFLQSEGHRVFVAHTGAAALRMLQHSPIGVALVDLGLPDMGGMDVIQRARALEVPPEVILLTGQPSLDSAMAAMEAGTSAYLQKPVDLARLGDLVRRGLERRQLATGGGRAAEDLAARLREVEALLAISHAASSTLEIPEAMRRIIRVLARLAGADTGAVYVLDPGPRTLLPLAGYRIPKELLSAMTTATAPITPGGLDQLWREGPIATDDVAGDPRFDHEIFRRFEHQSGLILPLALEGDLAGVFYLGWWTERRQFDRHDLEVLEQACAQVTILLRNARRFEQAEHERRRLDALYNTSRRLAALQDTDAILSLLLEDATRLLGVDAAGIRLLEGDQLVVAARTSGAGAVMNRERIKVGESLSGRVVATGLPIVVEDLAADERHDPEHKRGALAEGYHAFLGVPLRTHEVIGALSVFARQRRQFSADEVSLVSTLADQAALAIEKARLLRETQEARSLIERVYRVAVSMQRTWDPEERLRAFVEGGREAVGFDRIFVLLATPDGAQLRLAAPLTGLDELPPPVPLTAEAGPFEQVVRTQRPVTVLSDEDLARVAPLGAAYRRHPFFRTTRFLVVPLVVGDRVLGVAVADNKESRRIIPPASLEPFSLLCQQLATSLEEARLYHEADQRASEVAALARVGEALTSTLDLEQVLAAIAEHAADLVGAQRAIVFEMEPDGSCARARAIRGMQIPQGFPVYPGQGAPGLSIAERRPVWRRDVREDLVKGADQFVPHLGMTVGEAVQQWGYRSVLAVPIISRDTALGAVCIYWDDPHEPDDRELRVLSAMARQAAVAMENARHYAETRTQQTRLAQILESTSDGILVVGRDGRIEAANNRAGRMLRFDHAGSIGLQIIEVLERYRGNVANFEQTAVALAALTADPDQEMAGDMDIRSLKRVVHWTARPTRDGAGATVGFTLTFQDVTQEREVSQMKSDFVSFVTHQLRTPLAGIRWMLELAAQEPGVPAEATSFVQDARDSAQRLITLVNDLLDISRLERGRMTMAPEPVNLGELTRGVLDEMAPLITEKGHKLTVRGVRAVPRALADPQLLRQVVLNLVSNAVKYTPTGGRIALRMEGRADGVQWSIRDSGIGIPAAALPRMFEKFYRAENVHAVETEGTGLGLYLVRLILEQSGGRVWCESREGQGSTFTFTLPQAEGEA